MKAGKSNFKVGDKVVISGITDEDYKFLNEEEAVVTHPFSFGCQNEGWVGLYFNKTFTQMRPNNRVNLEEKYIKLIENE